MIVHFPNGAYALVSQTQSSQTQSIFEHPQTVKITGTKGALWASWSGAIDRTRHPTLSLRAFDGNEVTPVPIDKPTGELFELEDQVDRVVEAIADGHWRCVCPHRNRLPEASRSRSIRRAHLTTKLTIRPGTTIDLAICLPLIADATASLANAASFIAS